MLLTFCLSLCQCDYVCCALALVYGVVYNSINTLHILSCLTTNTMYSCTVWGGGGGVVEYFTGMNVFSSFSKWEPTCMYCVHLALWTPKVLCIPKFLCTICKFPFIHFIHSSQESKGCYTICNICSQSAVVLQNSSTVKRHSNTVIVYNLIGYDILPVLPI